LDRQIPRVLRSVFAEFLGSLLLSTIVIGSGIAAATLSPQDVGLQLLENAFATALGLFVLILVFAPISGAHFNPLVSLVAVALGCRSWRDCALYIPVQILGCIAGAALANEMFALPAVTFSTNDGLTGPHFLAEIVSTAGLLLVIFSLARSGRPAWTPPAVGAYIGAAYFFTSSTGFANPAITVGRMFTNSFAGVAPGAVPGFVGAQLAGAALGYVLIRALFPLPTKTMSAPRAGSGE